MILYLLPRRMEKVTKTIPQMVLNDGDESHPMVESVKKSPKN